MTSSPSCKSGEYYCNTVKPNGTQGCQCQINTCGLSGSCM